jgi:hypothetical protein
MPRDRIGNPFDPSQMRIGWQEVEQHPVPRHDSHETFLRGPIPWSWWIQSALLPGKALHVASAIRYLVGRKVHWRGEGFVSLALEDLDPFLGVNRQATRRGLRVLRLAGLVEVGSRPGCKFRVRICERTNDLDPRMLRGPIPWSWWIHACRLPGRTLHVASAVWAMVGWNDHQSARCEFSLEDLSELGLGRKAVHWGLLNLESAGLIRLESRHGLPFVVTLLPRSESCGSLTEETS